MQCLSLSVWPGSAPSPAHALITLAAHQPPHLRLCSKIIWQVNFRQQSREHRWTGFGYAAGPSYKSAEWPNHLRSSRQRRFSWTRQTPQSRSCSRALFRNRQKARRCARCQRRFLGKRPSFETSRQGGVDQSSHCGIHQPLLRHRGGNQPRLNRR